MCGREAEILGRTEFIVSKSNPVPDFLECGYGKVGEREFFFGEEAYVRQTLLNVFEWIFSFC